MGISGSIAYSQNPVHLWDGNGYLDALSSIFLPMVNEEDISSHLFFQPYMPTPLPYGHRHHKFE